MLLSSCQTGQGSTEEGIRGVANQLLHVEVPAVVGMSFSIYDFYATRFAAKLYEELTKEAEVHQAFFTAIQHIKSLESQYQGQAGQMPSQWMIPQLYTSKQVSHLVDWQGKGEKLTLSSIKFATGKERLLLEAQKDYLFIGRRKERRDALQALREEKAVLLRGQGGVGKTSLAEHLVGRLIAENRRSYPFLMNEQDFSTAESLLEQIKNYLKSQHKKFLITSQTAQYEKLIDKLNFLLQELVEVCDPLFVFDNLESFQEGPGENFKGEYSDMQEVLYTLLSYKTFPIILTGRYPLPEKVQVPTVNLNQVGYGDFFRKCLQLSFQELLHQEIQRAKRIQDAAGKPVSFPQLVGLLHSTLGGNYRALEFFDQVYQEKKETHRSLVGKIIRF